MPNEIEDAEIIIAGEAVSSVGARPIVNDHLPKQKPGQVTIGGNTYRLPALGRMNRAAVKKLTPLLAKPGLRQISAPDGEGTPFPRHYRLAWG